MRTGRERAGAGMFACCATKLVPILGHDCVGWCVRNKSERKGRRRRGEIGVVLTAVVGVGNDG